MTDVQREFIQAIINSDDPRAALERAFNIVMEIKKENASGQLSDHQHPALRVPT